MKSAQDRQLHLEKKISFSQIFNFDSIPDDGYDLFVMSMFDSSVESFSSKKSDFEAKQCWIRTAFSNGVGRSQMRQQFFFVKFSLIKWRKLSKHY